MMAIPLQPDEETSAGSSGNEYYRKSVGKMGGARWMDMDSSMVKQVLSDLRSSCGWQRQQTRRRGVFAQVQ